LRLNFDGGKKAGLYEVPPLIFYDRQSFFPPYFSVFRSFFPVFLSDFPRETPVFKGSASYFSTNRPLFPFRLLPVFRLRKRNFKDVFFRSFRTYLLNV
jgi:hypothetical protein